MENGRPMIDDPSRIVTVFGGTGFLGRRVALHLRHRGFPVRIAARHPDRCRGYFSSDNSNTELRACDIYDERSVANALLGAYGAVNATSLYVERGRETFQSVHVEAAERLACLAQHAACSNSFMSPVWVPTLRLHRSTSASEAKASTLFRQRSLTPSSCDLP